MYGLTTLRGSLRYQGDDSSSFDENIGHVGGLVQVNSPEVSQKTVRKQRTGRVDGSISSCSLKRSPYSVALSTEIREAEEGHRIHVSCLLEKNSNER